MHVPQFFQFPSKVEVLILLSTFFHFYSVVFLYIVFESLYRCVNAVFNAGKSFSSLFLLHIVCQRRLWLLLLLLLLFIWIFEMILDVQYFKVWPSDIKNDSPGWIISIPRYTRDTRRRLEDTVADSLCYTWKKQTKYYFSLRIFHTSISWVFFFFFLLESEW